MYKIMKKNLILANFIILDVICAFLRVDSGNFIETWTPLGKELAVLVGLVVSP